MFPKTHYLQGWERIFANGFRYVRYVVEIRSYLFEHTSLYSDIQIPFEFEQGACATFGKNGQKAVLCAPKSNGRQCWSFDGLNFDPFDETHVSHVGCIKANFITKDYRKFHRTKLLA